MASKKHIFDIFSIKDLVERYSVWPPVELYPIIALAQHYGLPTRFLDWTWNPYTASYFATKSVLDLEENRGFPAAPRAAKHEDPPGTAAGNLVTDEGEVVFPAEKQFPAHDGVADNIGIHQRHVDPPQRAGGGGGGSARGWSSDGSSFKSRYSVPPTSARPPAMYHALLLLAESSISRLRRSPGAMVIISSRSL